MGQKKYAARAASSKQSRVHYNRYALLLSGIAMSLSGLIIQCHYHLAKNPDESLTLALNRVEWNTLHVWTSIAFLAATIFHIWRHRRWYVQVFRKNLLSKHRPTVLLTILTGIVVVSGLTPWLIDSFGGDPALRHSIVEIHDKIAIVLLIAAALHAVKRLKRRRGPGPGPVRS